MEELLKKLRANQNEKQRFERLSKVLSRILKVNFQ